MATSDGNVEGSVKETTSEDPIEGCSQNDIEVETIDNDIFEVLDKATDLGTLEYGKY